MKSLKKLLLGLAALAVTAGAFWLFSGPKALAATVYVAPSEVCVPAYTPAGKADHHAVKGWLKIAIQDRAHFTATYGPVGTCASGKSSDPAIFFGQSSFSDIFQNISGTANQLSLYDSTSDSNVSYNQPVGSSGRDDTVVNGFGSGLDNLMNDHSKSSLVNYDALVSTADLKAALANTQLHLGLESSKTGYGCSTSSVGNGSDNFVLVDGNPPHWTCVNSTSISGLAGLVLGADAFSNLDNFNISYVVQKDSSGKVSLESVFDNQKNAGHTLVWCPGVPAAPGSFVSDNCTGNLRLQATADQINALAAGSQTFTMSALDGSQAYPVKVAGAESTQAGIAGGGNTNLNTTPTGGTDDACTVQAGSFELAYFFCPMLNIAQTLTDHLEGLFESQLSFTISNSVNTNGQAKIYKSWAIFRDIASSILVLVMLMMVISQAVGGGPFEAYTIKKMLPRLVIATIIMQISFQLFSWMVNIVDDVGHGLSFIMYFPFGGEGNMGLRQLLDNANLGGWSQAGINWTLFGAAWFGTTAFLGPVLAAAFGAALALLTGIAVLEFRKLLIFLLLILVPLALIAWTFPGQSMQGYWKKWLDNFLKTLFMYPMLIMLIAAGRVMAYVAGNTGGGTFLNSFIILIGFFGPLFVLPKTYKWGGSLMSAAGGAMDKWQSTASRAAKPGIKNWASEKFTDKWANSFDPFKRTLGSRRLAAFTQSVKGGRVLPTKAAYAKMVHRGSQWSGKMAERNDAVRDKFVRTAEEHGLSAKDLLGYHGYAMRKFGFSPFTQAQVEAAKKGVGLRPGIGTGKKAGQLLGFLAAAKGDSELKKSIGRYHIKAKSLLELADKDFVFPQEKLDKTGQKVWRAVPFWDWQPAIDQEFKDPDMWREMSSMRGDLTPNNVPRGGARYQKIFAKAGLARAIDANGKEFEISQDLRAETPVDERYEREFKNPDGSLRVDEDGIPRLYLAQKLQAIDQDTLDHASKGGNSLLSFANEITGWTEGDGYYGEGSSNLPAQEFAEFVAKQMQTATGRASLAKFKSTTDHVIAIDKALAASGYGQFIDVVGRPHDLTVEELFKASEDAEKELAARKQAAAQQGREYSADPNAGRLTPRPGGGTPPTPPTPSPPSPSPDYRDGGGSRPPDDPGVQYYARPGVTTYQERAMASRPLPTETGLLHGSGSQQSGGGVVFDRRQLAESLDELTAAVRHQSVEERKTREALRNTGAGRPIRSGPEWPSEGPPPGGEGPKEQT